MIADEAKAALVAWLRRQPAVPVADVWRSLSQDPEAMAAHILLEETLGVVYAEGWMDGAAEVAAWRGGGRQEVSE
jgi:hypothetical protein